MKSYMQVVLAAVCWGMTGLFAKTLTAAGFGQLQLVAVRVVIAAIGMFFIILFKDKNLFKIKLKDIWCFFGTGFLSLLFFNICYFQSMQYSTLSVAAVLLYTAPLFVVVFSTFLFKEKLTIAKCVAMVLMIAGCVFVTGLLSSTGSISVIGILFGLGSGFAYALYSIFGRFALNRGYQPFTVAFYTFLFASIGILPFSDISGMIPLVTVKTSVYMALLGIVSCLLPYILYTKGLIGLENGKASMISTVEPVVATLISVFIFGESFTINTALGILFIVGGICIMNAQFKKPHIAKSCKH